VKKETGVIWVVCAAIVQLLQPVFLGAYSVNVIDAPRISFLEKNKKIKK